MAVKWLVCLYIDVLPIQTTLRIWDCLLYEGHKVIFRVALALFGIRSERVRDSKNLPDFVDALNHFHQDKRVVNCHHFMSVSYYAVNYYPEVTFGYNGYFWTFSYFIRSFRLFSMKNFQNYRRKNWTNYETQIRIIMMFFKQNQNVSSIGNNINNPRRWRTKTFSHRTVQFGRQRTAGRKTQPFRSVGLPSPRLQKYLC